MTNNTINTARVEPILIRGWPMVEVVFQGAANQQQVAHWLREMDALIDKKQPFGLLTKTTSESDFSDLARKAMGLWFKQQKELIGRWCVGVSRVAPNQDAVQRMAGEKMQAAMPCPIFASASEDEARQWLEGQLRVLG